MLRGSSRTGDDWNPADPPDKLWVSLSLFTDIWFPRVIGLHPRMVHDEGINLDYPLASA